MKIMKDGDMYLVAANEFVDLQESDCYFFITEEEYLQFINKGGYMCNDCATDQCCEEPCKECEETYEECNVGEEDCARELREDAEMSYRRVKRSSNEDNRVSQGNLKQNDIIVSDPGGQSFIVQGVVGNVVFVTRFELDKVVGKVVNYPLETFMIDDLYVWGFYKANYSLKAN